MWAVINRLIALALMPFAPKRASRTGIIGPSIPITPATIIVGYAASWLAVLAFKIDFRFWIVALKLMSAKQFLIFLIYLVRGLRDLVCGGRHGHAGSVLSQ